VNARVPEKFRDVQWTRLPAGEVPAALRRAHIAPARTGDRKAPAARRRPVRCTWRRGDRGAGVSCWRRGGAVVAGTAVTLRMIPRSTAIASCRPAVRERHRRPGDRVPERRHLGEPHQQVGRHRGAARDLAHVRLRLQGKKMEPRRSAQRSASTPSSSARSPSAARTSPSPRSSCACATRASCGAKYSRRSDERVQVEGEIAAPSRARFRLQLSGKIEGQACARGDLRPEAYRCTSRGADYLVGTQQEMDKSIRPAAAGRGPSAGLRAGPRRARGGVHRARPSCAQADARNRSRKPAPREACARAGPRSREAHTALGPSCASSSSGTGGAEAELRRAVELKPRQQRRPRDVRDLPQRDGPPRRGAGSTARRRGRTRSRWDPRTTSSSVPCCGATTSSLGRGIPQDHRDRPEWTWGYIKLARALPTRRNARSLSSSSAIGERKIAGGAAPDGAVLALRNYAMCGDLARARQSWRRSASCRSSATSIR
jgi:hypothetical protein